MLSPDQVQAYHRDGFLTLPGFLAPDVVAATRERVWSIVDACPPPGGRAAVFSSAERALTTDAELFAAAEAVRGLDARPIGSFRAPP